MGPLVAEILREQFQALRSGDRHWHRRTLPRFARRLVARTRLSDIVRRNTNIGLEVPDDLFHVQ